MTSYIIVTHNDSLAKQASWWEFRLYQKSDTFSPDLFKYENEILIHGQVLLNSYQKLSLWLKIGYSNNFMRL